MTKKDYIEGKTKAGFAYKIKYNNLNNMELLDVFAEIDENPLAVAKAINMLLGKEGKKALYDFVRLKDGTVPADLVTENLMEIFSSIKEIKN